LQDRSPEGQAVRDQQKESPLQAAPGINRFEIFGLRFLVLPGRKNFPIKNDPNHKQKTINDKQ
jgi:hypothetical protein